MNQNDFVYINKPFAEIKKVNIDKLSELRVILVSPGAGLINMFGHTLLHLVLDGQEDIVMSYRGVVHDIKMSKLKGLTYLYQIRPFCFSLDRAIFEYTTNLNRSMTSYKLNLTSEELVKAKNNITHDYWNYKGGYHFIARNCVHGVFQLLQNSFSRKISNSFFNYNPTLCIQKLFKLDLITERDKIFFKSLENCNEQESLIKCERFKKYKSRLDTSLVELAKKRSIKP